MPISKVKRYIDAPQYPKDYGYSQKSLRSMRSYRRKDQKRRLTRNSLYTPMGRSFPAVLNMKFTYNKTFALVSTATAVNFIQFRLNSIWDPDYSAGLGQLKATPWNEMSAIY